MLFYNRVALSLSVESQTTHYRVVNPVLTYLQISLVSLPQQIIQESRYLFIRLVQFRLVERAEIASGGLLGRMPHRLANHGNRDVVRQGLRGPCVTHDVRGELDLQPQPLADFPQGPVLPAHNRLYS